MKRRVRQLGHLLDPVNEADRQVSRWIAALPPSAVDGAMKGLSTAANHSLRWFAAAGALAVRRGATRKAARRGVLAIALASTTANALCKPLLPRRRPAAVELPAYQKLMSPPTSSSFPSGHAASAAAFATAVGMESPKVGLALAPVAAAVAYSRVHVGVHWASDVVVGAALGAGVATLTRRWWPVRLGDEAWARPAGSVPTLPGGEGMVMLVNPHSGDSRYDPTADVTAALPRAEILGVQRGSSIDQQLEAALARHADGNGGGIKALGITGGDGSVGAAAAVAHRHGLPLVVAPLGTLNHFARDVGVYDLLEVVDATRAGEAVDVDLALVDVHASGSDAAGSASVVRTRPFLNTASIGSYPELVRLREKWQPRWGKWPAFAAALLVVLRRTQPVHARFLGEWREVWFLFIGNGPYYPRGMVPAWRPRLDSGQLDVRWMRADVRFARLRVAAALIFGALGHSRVYEQREVPELDVELKVPGMLATDGEVVEDSGRYTFRVAGQIPVYRRDEQHWEGRPRPFVGRPRRPRGDLGHAR